MCVCSFKCTFNIDISNIYTKFIKTNDEHKKIAIVLYLEINDRKNISFYLTTSFIVFIIFIRY